MVSTTNTARAGNTTKRVNNNNNYIISLCSSIAATKNWNVPNVNSKKRWTVCAPWVDVCVDVYVLGWCYENGEGVPRDMAKAVELYELAATQGDAAARFHLGNKWTITITHEIIAITART